TAVAEPVTAGTSMYVAKARSCPSSNGSRPKGVRRGRTRLARELSSSVATQTRPKRRSTLLGHMGGSWGIEHGTSRVGGRGWSCSRSRRARARGDANAALYRPSVTRRRHALHCPQTKGDACLLAPSRADNVSASPEAFKLVPTSGKKRYHWTSGAVGGVVTD